MTWTPETKPAMTTREQTEAEIAALQGKLKTMPKVGSATFYGVSMKYHSLYPKPVGGYGYPVDRMTFTFPAIDDKHVPGVYTSPDGLQIVVEMVK